MTRPRPGPLVLLLATVSLALVAAACSSSTADGTVPTTAPSAGSTTTPSAGGASSVATTSGGAAVALDGATVPPGGALPTDAECRSRVTPAPEVRPANAKANGTPGTQKSIPEKWLERVTGDFTGTTDEIIQWGACKWGIDPDVARAQAAKESYWNMDAEGDWSTDAAACPTDHGLGVDGKDGQCPESFGLLQIRWLYHGPPANRPTWPEAVTSTAYNVDYTYAIWRSCYEGDLTWLNEVDKGATYAAGDAWGCLGVWFAGRWMTEPARQYIDAVRTYRNDRIWTTSDFRNAG